MSGNEGSDNDEIDEKSIISHLHESIEEESDSEDALPEKSRIVYNSAYNKFIEWKRIKGDEQISEELMVDYFIYLHEVQKKKPSTLWSIYSMLKLTIKNNEKINIGKFKKLNAYLKEQSVGFKSKKTKSLTSSDIENFLNEAPDRKYLAVKVSLIFAIIGACRREELCNITINDIEDDGTFALIKIRNPETESQRSFTIVDEFYGIYKKYAILRPKYAKTDRFFMQYLDGKCTQQVIGINKFGSMPRLIASWLKLPDAENYTGHSFRRSSAILLADSGTDPPSFETDSAFKTKVAKCHAKNSLNRKKRLSEQIMKTVIMKSSNPSESEPIGSRPSTSLSPASSGIQKSAPSTSKSSTSAPNFETIYFPVKEEISEDNCEVLRDENPLREKNSGELSRKGTTSAIVVRQRTILPSGSSVSMPLPVLTPLPPQQAPPRTLYLRKILPKGGTAAATPNPRAKPLILKKNKVSTPGKQASIQKPQETTPEAPVIVQIPPETTPVKSAGVCLRWKSYHSNMQNSFPSLLDSEEFVDVTLACEGKSVKCHKIILSSCSDYLAQLLRENPCSHPIILMKDSKFWEIEALVQFMYKGETHVPHEQLPELLKAAKALGIKGLAGFTLAKVQKRPPEASKKPQKPFSQTNPSTAQLPMIQLTNKKAPKRSLESIEKRGPVKIRLCTKSRELNAESPGIKSESIDLPQSPIHNISEDNCDDIVQDYIDLVKMHEDDDPGGELMRTSDCVDGNERLNFVGNEFLDDEDILDVIDRETLSETSANDILRTMNEDSNEESLGDDDVNGKSKEKDET